MQPVDLLMIDVLNRLAGLGCQLLCAFLATVIAPRQQAQRDESSFETCLSITFTICVDPSSLDIQLDCSILKIVVSILARSSKCIVLVMHKLCFDKRLI